MARVPITMMGYQCERCIHEWIPLSDKEPTVCPKCKSPYWNSPRRATPMLSYETFRDHIKRTLDASTEPLTWTEIRTAARLPQAFPNNKWVHRLEQDIALIRAKNVHGIILWQLHKEILCLS